MAHSLILERVPKHERNTARALRQLLEAGLVEERKRELGRCNTNNGYGWYEKAHEWRLTQ
jgi:hypothetical protein